MEISIHRFLDHLRDHRGAARNTLLAYRTDLEQFHQVLAAQGAVFPVDLDQETIESYVRWLRAQGYRPATVSRKMAATRSYLEFLGEGEGAAWGQLKELLRAPPSPRKEPRTLSQGELDRLLNAPARRSTAGAIRDHAILSLLYETGFRAAEIVNLMMSDIDVEAGQIFKPPERSEAFPIPRSLPALQRYLREGRPHLSKHPGEETLFLNQRGNGLSRQGLWLVVKRWASAAGLGADLSPQTLRHTRARDLLDAGKTRREVQMFLGLSSPNAIRIHRTKNKTEAQ